MGVRAGDGWEFGASTGAISKEIQSLLDFLEVFRREAPRFSSLLFPLKLLQALGDFGAMDFAFEAAFAELGKNVEQTDEIARISLDFFAQGGTVEIGQELAQLRGGKLKEGFVEFAGVFFAEDIEGKLFFNPRALPSLQFAEPLFVTALPPTLEVVVGQPPAGLPQFQDNLGVGRPSRIIMLMASLVSWGRRPTLPRWRRGLVAGWGGDG